MPTYVTDDRAILGGGSLAGYDANGKALTKTPVFVSYSIETSTAGLIAAGELNGYPQAFIDSFAALNAGQASAARTAFAQWDAASGITYFEVPSGQGDIKLATFNFDLGGPHNSQQAAAYGGGGIVFVSKTDPFADVQLFLHEIGHNMGFKHSFEGDYILPSNLDNYSTTVMSYTSGGYSGSTLGSLDKTAAVDLYGAPGTDGSQVASWSWNANTYTLTQQGFGNGAPIHGVGGNNVIQGGTGANMIAISAGSSADTNIITGGGGDNTINISTGGASDSITTFGGNDQIYINGPTGKVTASTGAGNDTIYFQAGTSFNVDGGDGTDLLVLSDFAGSTRLSVADYLAQGSRIAGIENINIYGNDLDETLVASNIATYLYGSGGNDQLFGGSANDTLDGGTGADRMAGGAGDDSYYVDNAGDVVVEDANAGADWVFASISYTLPANVENLYLLGRDSLAGTGNELANLIIGNEAADILTGGAGADILTGGAGADIFRDTSANIAGDTITDFSVGDRINVSDAGYAGFGYVHSGSGLSFGGVSMTIGSPALRLVTASSGSGGTDLIAASRESGLGDFNGDGHGDVLWQNASGAVSTWSVSGNAQANQLQQNSYFASVPAGWSAVDTFDMNGDGRSDILWRNTSGAVSVWSASGAGTGFAQGSYNAFAGTDWKIAATGDVNGDGKDDILWRNDSGAISIWQSTGASFAQNSYYHASVGTGWHVAGLADLDGDGLADILWRNDNGAISEWRSTGTGFAENVYYDASVGTDWRIVGMGDFNGDGKTDILWRNSAGAISEWQSTGAGFAKNTYFNASVGNSWQVAQIADFNDDGKDDILWHNASGAISIWQSNGNAFDQNTLYNPGADTSWHIQAHDIIA